MLSESPVAIVEAAFEYSFPDIPGNGQLWSLCVVAIEAFEQIYAFLEKYY